MKFTSISLLLVLVGALTVVSCQKDGNNQYGIFTVEPDGATVIMDGVIHGNTARDWEDLMADHDEVNRIVMLDCPGSEDDETNLVVAKAMHDAGMAMHLNANSEIASGAVDLFLAGTTRTADAGAKLGVHSWSGDGVANAADLAQDDPRHELFLAYYESIGMSRQQASDFYFFTINAAPAEDIHWMTASEMDAYEMLTD